MNPRFPPRRRTVAGGAALLLVLAADLAAQGAGDLLVAPTRVVFAGRERSAEISLLNTGNEPATYRISFVQMRMNEQGGMAELDPAAAVEGERFADALIRFSPRQVTLEPRVAQTVRLQVRRPADLAEGEYRSHLLFRAVPTDDAALRAAAAPAAQFRVQLRPIYGVSIPVIVRQGEPSATVALSGPRLVPGGDGAPAILQVSAERRGEASVYGNVTVHDLPPRAAAAGRPIGRANGIAIYVPNPTRRLEIPLERPASALPGGRLLARFTTTEGVELAHTELAWP